MTKSVRTYVKWLDKGYALFAEDGLEGITVERLARELDLNKSGFYHYFGDRDTYLTRLMEKHEEIAVQMTNELKSVSTFDPDFFHFLIRHSQQVLAHNQLVRNRQHPMLERYYAKVNEIIDPQVVRLFAGFIGLADRPELASKYYSQVRDMFYAQITRERLNLKYLREFTHQAKAVIQEAIAVR